MLGINKLTSKIDDLISKLGEADSGVEMLEELGTLKEQVEKLKKEILDLEDVKRREDENIKHSTKIIMEKNEIEFEKEKAVLLRQKDEEVAKIKDEYRDKMEKTLEKNIEDGNKRYSEILERLPTVRVGLKGEV